MTERARPTIFDQFPEIEARVVDDVKDRPSDWVVQPQLHGDTIVEVVGDGIPYRGDALFSQKAGYKLGISIADCVAILLYDPEHKAIAAVHSGWRGSALNIVGKAVKKLADCYQSQPQDLRAYISPAARACHYEIGPEVAEQFDDKFITKRDGRLYLENQEVVKDQLLKANLDPNNIELDAQCTIHNEEFQSFRRDGDKAGRMIAYIGRRD